VLNDGMSSICRDTLKTAVYASIAAYLGYRVTKNIYVHYKVSRAVKTTKRELKESEDKIKESLESWRNSVEYAELSKLFQKDLFSSVYKEGETVEDLVTALPFNDLLAALQSGHLSAYTVLKSYQAKALKQRVEHNSICGWIDEADAMARALDDLPEGKRKAFHGIPISVKECFNVKNTRSTAGMIAFFEPKNTSTSPGVQTVINLGAVPFCKTNVPHTMYGMECSNPLYGATTNPHNALRDVGGSSGGEGSLIGGGGSILGIGSDIGGSLRNPAAVCGIYSMKPTIGRHFNWTDVVENAGPAPAGCQAVGGFMASSPAALEYAWRTFWNCDDEDRSTCCDPTIIPMPFNEDLYKRKMKIGFFLSDGLFESVPAVKRAVLEAVDLLKNNDYEVVAIPPPDYEKVLYLFNGLIMATTEDLEKSLSWDLNSSATSGLRLAIFLLNTPRWIRRLLFDPLHALFTRLPKLENKFGTAKQVYTGLEDKHELTEKYLQMMKELGVEILLCPAQNVPAPKLGVTGQYPNIITPYLAWNMFNMPAGIAPITRYADEDTKAMVKFPKNDLVYKMQHSICQNAEGLPLGVQVVGRPYHEEQVLHVLNLLHRQSSYH